MEINCCCHKWNANCVQISVRTGIVKKLCRHLPSLHLDHFVQCLEAGVLVASNSSHEGILEALLVKNLLSDIVVMLTCENVLGLL